MERAARLPSSGVTKLDFRLSAQAIEPRQLTDDLTHPSAGAVVAFEGRVRDHNDGRVVSGLSYEAYAALAEDEGAQILAEARTRFQVISAHCVHRTGALAIGEVAVWVGVSAAHRDAAFAACRYVIDEVKTRVPIWKRETYADGDTDWLHPGSGQETATPDGDDPAS